jgi:phage replication initiation protein
MTPFGYKAHELKTWGDTILSLFLTELLKFARITRLDVAIDDIGVEYYTLDEVVEKQKKQRIISKWRTCRNLSEHIIADNVKIGHTLYFGSTQSEIQLRIYDKQLEQNKGLTVDSSDYITIPWVRWELELHDDRANECAKLLANNMSIGNVAFGILSHYFRVIKLDDINKSRCSSEAKWNNFIGNVKRLKLTVIKEEKTLDEEQKQWEQQNGRKVSKMFAKNGGDLGYFGDLATRYMDKLTPHDREQLGWID